MSAIDAADGALHVSAMEVDTIILLEICAEHVSVRGP
jgi:hypothetical protein